MRFTDAVCEDLDARLAPAKVADHVDYDVTLDFVQTPDGPVVVCKLFFLTANPIIGEGPLCTVQVVPAAVVTNGVIMDRVVVAALNDLRTMRQTAIAGTN